METTKFQGKEEQKEKPVEKEASIKLMQVPTEFGLVFRTPDGDMEINTYLAYLGNLIYELKKSVVG